MYFITRVETCSSGFRIKNLKPSGVISHLPLFPFYIRMRDELARSPKVFYESYLAGIRPNIAFKI